MSNTKSEKSTLELNVKPEVRNLADIFRKNLVVTVNPEETAANIVAGETTFVDNLPEGLTKETYEAVQAHNNNCMSALGLAAGEIGNDLMPKHAGLKKVHIDLPTVGKDYFAATYQREATIGANTHYGTLRVSHEVFGDKGANGSMTAVKDFLGAKAKELYGSL